MRLERVVRLRLLERDEAPYRSRVPERRLVVVQHVRPHARRTPGPARRDPGEVVLAL